jgi:DNA-binding GntR family transcriptional regulator
MFEPITHPDLVTIIARRITEAIVGGQLPPGARLNELHLARDFGTSRAPVREAARLLESQGLVQASPRRGFFVRTLTPSDLREIYELRIGLEIYASEIALAKIGPDEIAALKRQVDLMFTLADQGSVEKQVFEDFAFHRLLCAMSGNSRILRTFDEIATEMRAGIALIGKLYDNPHRIAETHLPIIEAMEARDAARVRGAIDYHIGTAKEAVVALFADMRPAAGVLAGETAD